MPALCEVATARGEEALSTGDMFMTGPSSPLEALCPLAGQAAAEAWRVIERAYKWYILYRHLLLETKTSAGSREASSSCAEAIEGGALIND